MSAREYKRIRLRVKSTHSNQLTINVIEQYLKEATYKRQLKQQAINNLTNNT